MIFGRFYERNILRLIIGVFILAFIDYIFFTNPKILNEYAIAIIANDKNPDSLQNLQKQLCLLKSFNYPITIISQKEIVYNIKGIKVGQFKVDSYTIPINPGSQVNRTNIFLKPIVYDWEMYKKVLVLDQNILWSQDPQKAFNECQKEYNFCGLGPAGSFLENREIKNGFFIAQPSKSFFNDMKIVSNIGFEEPLNLTDIQFLNRYFGQRKQYISENHIVDKNALQEKISKCKIKVW